MRLFFAVTLSPEIRSAVGHALDRFPVPNPPWRWVRSDNLHITLKFLGERDPASVAGLVQAAESACGEIPSFTLSFARFGAFPNLRAPRVLFYRAERGDGELKALAGALDSALQQRMSIPREKRPFRSHITVARIKRPLPRPLAHLLHRMEPLEGPCQEVDSIVLMESELRPSGAVYRPVKEIALR